MSINEGLGTAINIRVMERCDWINLQRKKNTTSASRMKFKWSVIDTKCLSDIIFFPAMLLRVAMAGKPRIAYHWVTEKKRNITLNNQRRSCNFDKLRKEESSLSYWVVASENEGSRPSCEWKWGAQGDLQVNLQAHLKAMHALTSDTAEQGPAPVLQHQHECYQKL